jgi:hypothetical protein
MKLLIMITMLLLCSNAFADKHFDRILMQAIEEAQADGPIEDAYMVVLWKHELFTLNSTICACGYDTKCKQVASEDYTMEFMPKFLRLPGFYKKFMASIYGSDAQAYAAGEELTGTWLKKNVTAKEQYEIRKKLVCPVMRNGLVY